MRLLREAVLVLIVGLASCVAAGSAMRAWGPKPIRQEVSAPERPSVLVVPAFQLHR